MDVSFYLLVSTENTQVEIIIEEYRMLTRHSIVLRYGWMLEARSCSPIVSAVVVCQLWEVTTNSTTTATGMKVKDSN